MNSEFNSIVLLLDSLRVLQAVTEPYAIPKAEIEQKSEELEDGLSVDVIFNRSMNKMIDVRCLNDSHGGRILTEKSAC